MTINHRHLFKLAEKGLLRCECGKEREYKPISRKPKKRKKMSWAKRRTKEKNAMIKALDDDCRTRVFERDDNSCQMAEVPLKNPGCKGYLSWSHIVSRRFLCVRWDELNSMVKCAAHHEKWHQEPAQSMLWFQSKYPERAEHIQRTLQASPPDFGYTEIKEIYDQLAGGK